MSNPAFIGVHLKFLAFGNNFFHTIFNYFQLGVVTTTLRIKESVMWKAPVLDKALSLIWSLVSRNSTMKTK